MVNSINKEIDIFQSSLDIIKNVAYKHRRLLLRQAEIMTGEHQVKMSEYLLKDLRSVYLIVDKFYRDLNHYITKRKYLEDVQAKIKKDKLTLEDVRMNPIRLKDVVEEVLKVKEAASKSIVYIPRVHIDESSVQGSEDAEDIIAAELLEELKAVVGTS